MALLQPTCNVWQGAIGGENIGMMIEDATVSRSICAIRALSAIQSPRLRLGTATPSGAQVSLGTIRHKANDGPVEIKSENGRLVAYVY